MKKQSVSTTKQVVRVAGKLKEIVTIHDEAGNIMHKMISPLMVEFYFRDVLQVIVGASILAIPVAFTEETWRLGEELGHWNVAGLAVLSVLFVSMFVYYNFYKDRMADGKHWIEMLKRVLATYLVSLIVVALILTLIERADWALAFGTAIKRVVIVAFPASLSASVADVIK